MRRPEGDHWEHIEVFVQPLVRIPAGRYPARSGQLTRLTAWGRPTFVVDFDIFATDALLEPHLARLPMYLTAPGPRGATPRSKLGRWLKAAGLPLGRRRVPLDALQHKLWRVKVADVTRDYERQALEEPYSVVRSVLGVFS